MFKDYYAILEVSEIATQDEIKNAYKKQALRWHPDRNLGTDTTQKMQEINEAYLILKDSEARERYNQEYQRYKEFKKQKIEQERRKKAYQEWQEQDAHKRERERQKTQEEYHETAHSDFKVQDDILKRWMDNAKRQAVELAKQSIEDFRGMIAVGTKAAVKEGGSYLLFQLAISAIVLIIIFVIKSCIS